MIKTLSRKPDAKKKQGFNKIASEELLYTPHATKDQRKKRAGYTEFTE
jgi:hypothetical protein